LHVFLGQISGETVGEVRAVADMHQRKAEMARQSDAFIALPGTYGRWQRRPLMHAPCMHGARTVRIASFCGK
jgi:hypothetical protein